MEFLVGGRYSAFEELMYYYHFDFNVYYFLTLIVFVNCIKAVVEFICIKKGKISKLRSNYLDLIVSVLAGIGLMNGMFFQGVLSDISAKYSKIWGGKMSTLCITAFLLFIIQLILYKKIKNKNTK